MIREIVIPDYPDKVLVAKSRRVVHYVKPGSSSSGKKILPISYKQKLRSGLMHWDSKGVLCNADGSQVVANSRTAGRERYWVVNFQQIWNGAIGGAQRANYVNKLKDVLRPFIGSMPIIHGTDVYPLKLEILLLDYEFDIDVSNKGAIYTKVIEDLLVETGKIPDDGPDWIRDSGRIKYIKIPSGQQRAMKIRIYSSLNIED